MWRRSRRSANTPPIIVKSRRGKSPRKLSRPKKKADLDLAIVTISHACATFCIHVPTLDVRAPIQRRRKLRWVRAIPIRPGADRITSRKQIKHPAPTCLGVCKAGLIYLRLRCPNPSRRSAEASLAFDCLSSRGLLDSSRVFGKMCYIAMEHSEIPILSPLRSFLTDG